MDCKYKCKNIGICIDCEYKYVADSWVLLRLVRLSKVSVVFCASRVRSEPSSVPNILRIEATALLPYLAA